MLFCDPDLNLIFSRNLELPERRLEATTNLPNLSWHPEWLFLLLWACLGTLEHQVFCGEVLNHLHHLLPSVSQVFQHGIEQNFTLFFQFAFCSGAVRFYNFWTSHLTPEFQAFCGGAIQRSLYFNLHGLISAFCRGATDSITLILCFAFCSGALERFECWAFGDKFTLTIQALSGGATTSLHHLPFGSSLIIQSVIHKICTLFVRFAFCSGATIQSYIFWAFHTGLTGTVIHFVLVLSRFEFFLFTGQLKSGISCPYKCQLHGLQSAFCRGAFLQCRGFWLFAFNLAFWALCGGAIQQLYIPPHGSAPAFCRGAQNHITLILCFAFCSGAFVRSVGFEVREQFTPELLAFCGGALLHWLILSAHGTSTAFCRGGVQFLITLFHHSAFCSGALQYNLNSSCLQRKGTHYSSDLHPREPADKLALGSLWVRLFAKWARSAWIQIQSALLLLLAASALYILQTAHLAPLDLCVTPALEAFCGGAWLAVETSALFRHWCFPWTIFASIHWVFQLFVVATTIFSLQQRINVSPSSWWSSSRCSTIFPLRGESGPKSGHRWPCLSRTFVVLALYIAATTQAIGGGEGCGRTMTVTETSTTWVDYFLHQQDVKLHGWRPSRRSGNFVWPQDGTKVVKRSYKRAFLKATKEGHCWYKGRCLRAADFQLPAQLAQNWINRLTPSSRTRSSQPNLSRRDDGRHLRVAQWNVSGLSITKLDEIKCWLKTQPLDVLILLETHWGYTNEWCDDSWNFIHSGDSLSRSSGILCMVSKRLNRLQDLRWAEILPGRLMHLQLRFSTRHVDLVAGYQYTNSTQHRKLALRHTWWNSLDQYLKLLSKRNTLLLVGDFNCCLPKCGGHVGDSLFKWQGKSVQGVQHADAGLFLSILRAHNLVALNTFDPTLGPTFWNGDACSRIDFFITRQSTADGRAKRVLHLQAPFLHNGQMDHALMLCQIKRFWLPPASNQTNAGITVQQRQQGRDAWFQNTPEWQSYLRSSAAALQTFLHLADPSDSEFICALHQVAGRTFSECFPTRHVTGPQAVWHNQHGLILNKWKHRAWFKKWHVAHPRNIFLAWSHVTRFQVLRRQHRRFAWQARQHRFEQVIADAQSAADRHDSHRLFQTINKYAPKQPRRRMQLRNAQGCIASPVEELAILSAFVHKVWNGPHDLPHPISPWTGNPLTEQDVYRALRAIPPTKAVASPFTPGLIWSSHAELLAPFVHEALDQWWSTEHAFIPDCWRDSWMLLIPKPSKAPVSPEALRPLALQEPIGKSIIGSLARIAQTEASDLFATLPFWAYIRHRSTQHALNRVVQHCRRGRTLVDSQKPTAFARSQQLPSFKVCGAVQLFVDLQRAFDSVSRVALFQRLVEIGVHPRIVQILTSWHCRTSYHVTVGGSSQPMAVGSGVRQGCKAAPFLFNSYMAAFYKDLTSVVDETWLQEHLDLYADDLHTGSLFYSEHELYHILHIFGIILEQLQQKGLTINTNKSVIILAIAGTSHRRVRTSLLTETANGALIKIRGNTVAEFPIPVVKQTKYLGCLLGYTRFEDATMRHRLSLMRVAFTRLRTWLTARRGMPANTRLRLWTTCVLPVLTYGTFITGVTPTGLHKIQTAIFTMLRQILHNHSFISRLTHEQVLQHWCISHPLVLLWRAADSVYSSMTQSQFCLAADDLARQIDWSPVSAARDLIWQQYLTGRLDHSDIPANPTAQADASFTCESCEFQCKNLSTLRRHYTQSHGITPHRKYIAKLGAHMVQGMPQCKHCHQTFTTWRSFTAHIQRSCQVLHRHPPRDQLPTGVVHVSDQAAPMARPEDASRGQYLLSDQDLAHLNQQEFGPRLLTLLQQRRWSDIRRDRAACQFLASKCSLCGQYVGRAQAMHLHARVAHPIEPDLVLMKATQLSNLHCDDCPCNACGVTFVHQHVCNVWYQVALLLVHGAGSGYISPAEPAQPLLQCEICGMTCTDAASLHLHLLDEHKLVSSSWNESRDSVAGEPVCSHCLCLFETMEGLRSHINQGRCRAFDPQAPTETVPVADMWKLACCRGSLLSTLKGPQNRLRLTLHCQACTKKYTRAMDLAAHLQGSHSRLWSDAQPLAHQMVAHFYPRLGCQCNPSCNVPRLNHLCLPFVQLAMQFCRIPEAIFQPMTLTDMDLARVIPAHIPRDLRFRLERALLQFDVPSLWQDQPLMIALSHTCLMCGHVCPTAELCLHLYEAHNCTSSVIQSFVMQLTPHALKQMDNDHSCFACGLIFNHPGETTDCDARVVRQTLVQSHFRAQCPALVQLASALAQAHYGGGLADGVRRCLSSGASGIPEPGAASGRDIEAVRQSGGHQKTKSRRTSGQEGQALSGNLKPATGASGDGQAGTLLGQRKSAAEKGRHIPVLLQLQRNIRQPGRPEESGGGLASGGHSSAPIIIEDPLAPEVATDTFDRPAGSHSEVRGRSTGVSADATGSSDNDHSAGSHVPVPGVGPQHQGTPDLQADPHQHSEDASALHRAAGHVSRLIPDSKISCLAHSPGERSLSMAAPGEHSGRSPVGAAPIPVPIKRLDIDGHQLEAAQPPSVTFGDEVGGILGTHINQRERQRLQRPQRLQDPDEASEHQERIALSLDRTAMMTILAQLRLQNHNNWCFANSMFQTFLWCQLSLSHFQVNMWGVHRDPILRLLVQAKGHEATLAGETFVDDVLRCWGPSDVADISGSVNQQDAAEFVQHWLQLLHSTEF